MNDLLTDPKAWVLGLLGILGAIAVFLLKRELKRLDQMIADSVRREEFTRLDNLLAEAVRRDEFNSLRDDMDRRHGDNIERLDRIEKSTTGTNNRIDAIYEKIIEKIK
jgi:hypothetical protein